MCYFPFLVLTAFLFLPQAASASGTPQTVSASSDSIRLIFRLKEDEVREGGKQVYPSLWYELEIKNESKRRREVIDNVFRGSGSPWEYHTPRLEIVNSRNEPVNLRLPEPCHPKETIEPLEAYESRIRALLKPKEAKARREGWPEDDIQTMLEVERQAIEEGWPGVVRIWLAPGASRVTKPWAAPVQAGCDEIPQLAPRRWAELLIPGRLPGIYRVRAVYRDAGYGLSGIEIATPWVPLNIR